MNNKKIGALKKNEKKGEKSLLTLAQFSIGIFVFFYFCLRQRRGVVLVNHL